MHPEFKGIVRLSLVVCTISLSAADVAQPQEPVSPPIAFHPFIAYRTEKSFGDGDAEPKATTVFTFARRSDGSHVDSFTTHAPDGTPGSYTEIMDYRARQYISVEPLTKSVTTFPQSPAKLQRAYGVEKKCELLTIAPDAPRATLLGYDTVRVVEENRAERTEMWVAPVLDCYSLRSVSTSAEGARNESVVTSIVEGEPAESMFHVSSDYIERSPFQVEAAFMGRFHGSLFGESINEMERRYNAARP